MCIQEGEPVLVQNPLYSGTEVVVSYQKKTDLFNKFYFIA